MKVLMVKARSMGDSVIMTPSVRAVFLGLDKPDILIVTSRAGFEVFKNSPYVKKVFVYEKTGFLNHLKSFVTLVLALRKEKIDLAFGLYSSISECWLIFLSGIPKRVIYRHEYDKRDTFGNIKIKFRKELKSVIERDLDTLRSYGLKPADKKTEIFLDKNVLMKNSQYLTGQGISKPHISIFPYAGRAEKIPQLQLFIETARALSSKGHDVVFILPEGKAAASDFPGREFALFSGSVQEVSAMISASSLFIGNDTGFKHIAVALNVPTVTVISEKDFLEWHPYDQNMHRVLKYGKSVSEIRPEDLIGKVMEIWKK